ncbi:MAG: hypothetical protein ABSA21_07165 [Candidatus Limnocylindrales bacterium]|jgi:hypothetical protein
MAPCRPDRLGDYLRHAVEMLASVGPDRPSGWPRLTVEGLALVGPRMDRPYRPALMMYLGRGRDGGETPEVAR